VLTAANGSLVAEMCLSYRFAAKVHLRYRCLQDRETHPPLISQAYFGHVDRAEQDCSLDNFSF